MQFQKKGSSFVPMGKVKARISNILPGQTTGDVLTWEQYDPIGIVAAQATSITTGVTLNTKKGFIQTQIATTAAAGAAVTSFVVSDSFTTTSSNVDASINLYSGALVTNGIPYILITNVTTGSFTINILNNHPTNALNGTLQISFDVKN